MSQIRSSSSPCQPRAGCRVWRQRAPLLAEGALSLAGPDPWRIQAGLWPQPGGGASRGRRGGACRGRGRGLRPGLPELRSGCGGRGAGAGRRVGGCGAGRLGGRPAGPWGAPGRGTGVGLGRGRAGAARRRGAAGPRVLRGGRARARACASWGARRPCCPLPRLTPCARRRRHSPERSPPAPPSGRPRRPPAPTPWEHLRPLAGALGSGGTRSGSNIRILKHVSVSVIFTFRALAKLGEYP